ncbi:MAG: phosphoglycerate dehydrogenase [Hyphomonadaceae bacterium]
MPKVLIADKLSPAAVDIFKNRGLETETKVGLSKDELIKIIPDYDGLVVRSACKPDADIIAAASNLKVIGRAGIGVDNIDIKAATKNGVVVMNTPFGNAITTAEHAIAMMFAAARQIPAANAGTQAGEWPKKAFMGTELSYKTLGLIGCGNIGSRVAERAMGLSMKVAAYDPFLTEERAVELGVEKVDLETLLARADVITLHVPYTDQTANILSAANLDKTRKGVIIVNCARGGLIDETALKLGLESGHIAAAALDVFAEEPAKENPLFGVTNFIATPHLGAATNEAQENVALQVAEQMSDYLLTGAVTNALNMPSVTAEEAPRLTPFTQLAEKLGAFAGQISEFGFDEIVIEYEGEVSELNRKPITAAALAGILRPSRGDVNMVSAPSILTESGVKLTETKTEESPVYDSLIRIKVLTKATANSAEGGWRTLAGTVTAGRPRIVEIKGMALEGDFSPTTLYVNNLDKPGFIGSLGAMLSEAGVNIATFHLGRTDEGGEAIALVGIDSEPSDKMVDQLRAMERVRYAKVLRF